MKKYIITIFMLVSEFAPAQNAKEEKALEALINAGMVRKEGDVCYFKVKGEREASNYKLLYGALIDNPDFF